MIVCLPAPRKSSFAGLSCLKCRLAPGVRSLPLAYPASLYLSATLTEAPQPNGFNIILLLKGKFLFHLKKTNKIAKGTDPA
jgi:hypothetical protein